MLISRSASTVPPTKPGTMIRPPNASASSTRPEIDSGSFCAAVSLNFREQRRTDCTTEDIEKLRKRPGHRVHTDQSRLDKKSENDDIDLIERLTSHPTEPRELSEVEETREVPFIGPNRSYSEYCETGHGKYNRGGRIADEQSSELERDDNECDLDECSRTNASRRQDRVHMDEVIPLQCSKHERAGERRKDDNCGERGYWAANIRVNVLLQKNDADGYDGPDYGERDRSRSRVFLPFIAFADPLSERTGQSDLSEDSYPRDDREHERVEAEDLLAKYACEIYRGHETERRAEHFRDK